MKNINNYDVVVIGGGHAGVEAASASSRMGAKTALITHKINKIGVSIYDPDEIYYIKKKFKPDIIQIPFNIIDRRIISKRRLKFFKNIKIQVRSIFLQGLLLMNYDQRKKSNFSINISSNSVLQLCMNTSTFSFSSIIYFL